MNKKMLIKNLNLALSRFDRDSDIGKSLIEAISVVKNIKQKGN